MMALTESEEVLIAEYAIGLATPAEEREAQRLLSQSTEAQAALGFWADRLFSMTPMEPAADVPDVFPAVQARLFGKKPAVKRVNWIYLGLILAAAFVLVKLNVFLMFFMDLLR